MAGARITKPLDAGGISGFDPAASPGRLVDVDNQLNDSISVGERTPPASFSCRPLAGWSDTVDADRGTASPP